MVKPRLRAFTLIELLVVIAIIGILAAMVFPVFARARESARKAVCLSNVKNLALAIQMYLADNNDILPPSEHRAEVLEYFDAMPGGATDWSGTVNGHCCFGARAANPYLRWAVVFDEYVKNRDVWKCPSAKIETGAMFMVPYQDYYNYWRGTEGMWGTSRPDSQVPCVCHDSWPAGWGGEVTDSVAQNRWGFEAARHGFRQSIAVNSEQHGTKLVQIPDPTNFAIVGDGGVHAQYLSSELAAYPDICSLGCANKQCGWVDWEYCTWAADCGLYDYAPNDGSFLANPEFRKPYARHLGGVNMGFLDGHAQWINSETLVNKVKEGEIYGLEHWGPVSDCIVPYSGGQKFADVYPGVPTLW